MDTQNSKVYKMLKNSKRGVENYRFPQAGILRYSARINDLRKDGHNILTERQIINGRHTGVYKYYLLDE